MCTITFVPQEDGYAVAMNRDEKRSRIQALPPKVRDLAGCRVLCPSEPGGGTWIAVNEKRATFGLVNWYSVPQRVHVDAVSRGVVVASAAGLNRSGSVTQVLSSLPLKLINPFRLIGVFPGECSLTEWYWDLVELKWERRTWTAQQWISSGLDEPSAQKARSETFRRAFDRPHAGSLPWLRQLHQSHVNGPGPLSVCMHRPDATSVSYTEVHVSSGQARIRYLAGSPCQAQAVFESRLPMTTTNGSNHTELCRDLRGKKVLSID